MFALKGAKLMANYRGNREEAEAMASELSGCSSQVSLHGGDVSVPVDCQRLRDEIEKGAGRIDILVSNAFPRIEARSFLEQDSREFIGFVEKSLAATVTLFRELMPLVPKGGMVVLISSVFTESPKPQFSHYVAAKSALEGLLRVLALEFRDRQFVIVRAPRMLTDQTNLPFDLSRPLSPIEIGRRLLDAISSVRGPGNLHEINLSEEHPTPGLKAA
jgi:NAD(P)-dependent dehydrogenase (short-subunit alcohol dehydrogenase family)